MTTSRFLLEPRDFYEAILEKVNRSRNSIILAALYFGTGEQEMFILSLIDQRLTDHSDLVVTTIVDFSRTLRKNNPDQELQIFKPLLKKYGDRFRLYLYRMPQYSEHLSNQINEVRGVFHCKFGLFDEDVILTGANLSTEYFVDRQDRYLVLENCVSKGEANQLSYFLKNFVRILQPFCYRITVGGSICIVPPRMSDVEMLKQALEGLGEQRLQITNDTFAIPLIQFAPIGVIDEATKISNLLPLAARQVTGAGACSPRVHKALNIVISSPYPSFTPSFVHALSQASRVFLQRPNKKSISNDIGHRSSSDVIDARLRHTCSVQIVAPSSSAHGFSKSPSFSVRSLIPLLHSSALQEALHVMTMHSKSISAALVSIFLYNRVGWTMHAKGLWVFETRTPDTGEDQADDEDKRRADTVRKGEEEDTVRMRDGACSRDDSELKSIAFDSSHYRHVAYIGSSNLGARSWHCDFELGFLIYTNDAIVDMQLRDECVRLLQRCDQKNMKHVSTASVTTHKGAEPSNTRFKIRLLDYGIRVIMRAVRQYL